KCVYRTSRKRIPLIDPPLNCIPVADTVFDRHSNQGLAPLPMPLAIFIQRIKYLPEQVVVLTKSHIAQVLHEQFVHQGFENQVESDERFCPIISDEQSFNDFTQR